MKSRDLKKLYNFLKFSQYFNLEGFWGKTIVKWLVSTWNGTLGWKELRITKKKWYASCIYEKKKIIDDLIVLTYLLSKPDTKWEKVWYFRF